VVQTFIFNRKKKKTKLNQVKIVGELVSFLVALFSYKKNYLSLISKKLLKKKTNNPNPIGNNYILAPFICLGFQRVNFLSSFIFLGDTLTGSLDDLL